MSLFKINREGKETLKNQSIHDGYAYFTPEDEKFYIDIVGKIRNTDYSAENFEF